MSWKIIIQMYGKTLVMADKTTNPKKLHSIELISYQMLYY
jgi:hypothetical protein